MRVTRSRGSEKPAQMLVCQSGKPIRATFGFECGDLLPTFNLHSSKLATLSIDERILGWKLGSIHHPSVASCISEVHCALVYRIF